ncbi:L-lactate dehydrogenase complex protein LldF [Catalinimonas alkaloidigena]|uniref:L-lactate dehydrogenase complex protein LldF n=1 Tax=Catalinimonas alkaloidigena TaxID=1075417 RepID=A0A1G9KKL7_9BACT|nr:lactate utilization protein B [Catalinimonas alkaloidigena]SDL50192.1 L-lactate dehydrogenase complex protein LldF [Catalinimonas alkaloidigena]
MTDRIPVDHAVAADQFNLDEPRVNWHDETLWMVRSKRDRSSKGIPEWEALRELGSAIKTNMLSQLDEYLLEFEKNARANGIQVHWARNAAEHNQITLDIIRSVNGKKVVKSKSMLTEECHLNPYLLEHDLEVVDTDLGEHIVQLKGEPPSHIVMPAIHMKKEEIGELFHERLGTEKGNADPNYLTAAARQHLRQKFLAADVAITGVNFAVAETGGFVVCTNEGNADMGVHLAPVHIASMGIEKLIPKAEHLGVFLRLLARSATGQPVTIYSSHFHQPRPGAQLHVILVDNGRTEQLGRENFRRSLHCIRCGACMNTCPVYRRSGGHSYSFTVPGPIGAILAPGRDLKSYSSLPFASTLCGSCSDVCPVKINIHEQLYLWRQEIAKNNNLSPAKQLGMKFAGWLFRHPRLFRMAGKVGRWLLKVLPRKAVYNQLNPWGKGRELPAPPNESFHDWYQKHRTHG